MTVGQAVAASAARPDVFHAYSRNSTADATHQPEDLVDGGVACANPTLYAFAMARHLYKYEKIRILSLGTTHRPFEMFKPSAFSQDSEYIERGAMMENQMAYTADYFVSYNDYWQLETTTNVDGQSTTVGKLSPDYLRVDGVSTTAILDGSDTSTTAQAALKAEAAKLWTDHGAAIQTMLQQIIDEKAAKEGWTSI